jgi:tetratricopeptide (TPR) repeat protein
MSTRSSITRLFFALALVSAAALAISSARAASSGGSSSPPQSESRGEEAVPDEAQEMFDRGMQLVKEGDYEGARERFEKAVKKKKNNPDYVNMLAYTQRKTGHLEEAFENYEKALALKPSFPQAREYLGEAHIQAALLQVEALRQAGPAGAKELEMLVGAFERAATTLKAEPMGGGNATAVSPKEW